MKASELREWLLTRMELEGDLRVLIEYDTGTWLEVDDEDMAYEVKVNDEGVILIRAGDDIRG